jgi:hypothetical protein
MRETAMSRLMAKWKAKQETKVKKNKIGLLNMNFAVPSFSMAE